MYITSEPATRLAGTTRDVGSAAFSISYKMAAVDVGARNAPPVPAADDLDNLFDYDVGDVFKDVDTNIEVPPLRRPTARADGKENAAGLGIDEEIKVIRKKTPVAKLDESRQVLIVFLSWC